MSARGSEKDIPTHRGKKCWSKSSPNIRVVNIPKLFLQPLPPLTSSIPSNFEEQIVSRPRVNDEFLLKKRYPQTPNEFHDRRCIMKNSSDHT